MDITENITITLTEKDLQELIEESMEKKGFKLEGKIVINVGTQTVGYGTNEHDTTVFKNITTVFKNITCSGKKISGL